MRRNSLHVRRKILHVRRKVYKDGVFIDIVIKMKQLIKRIKLPVCIQIKIQIIYKAQSNKGQTEVATMPKYTQDVKDRAVEAAKEGISLAEIQRTIGPNPKATQRYLAKVGINYADLRKELVEAGKLKAPFNEQGPKARAKANKAKKQVNVTEEFVLEE